MTEDYLQIGQRASQPAPDKGRRKTLRPPPGKKKNTQSQNKINNPPDRLLIIMVGDGVQDQMGDYPPKKSGYGIA